jgi:hypothetical protein
MRRPTREDFFEVPGSSEMFGDFLANLEESLVRDIVEWLEDSLTVTNFHVEIYSKLETGRASGRLSENFVYWLFDKPWFPKYIPDVTQLKMPTAFFEKFITYAHRGVIGVTGAPGVTGALVRYWSSPNNRPGKSVDSKEARSCICSSLLDRMLDPFTFLSHKSDPREYAFKMLWAMDLEKWDYAMRGASIYAVQNQLTAICDATRGIHQELKFKGSILFLNEFEKLFTRHPDVHPVSSLEVPKWYFYQSNVGFALYDLERHVQQKINDYGYLSEDEF